MNKPTIVLVCTICIGSLIVAQAINFRSGRYQLVGVVADTTSMDNGVVTKQNKVFKIDTTNGETWEYISTFGKESDRMQQYWHRIGSAQRRKVTEDTK